MLREDQWWRWRALVGRGGGREERWVSRREVDVLLRLLDRYKISFFSIVDAFYGLSDGLHVFDIPRHLSCPIRLPPPRSTSTDFLLSLLLSSLFLQVHIQAWFRDAEVRSSFPIFLSLPHRLADVFSIASSSSPGRGFVSSRLSPLLSHSRSQPH